MPPILLDLSFTYCPHVQLRSQVPGGSVGGGVPHQGACVGVAAGACVGAAVGGDVGGAVGGVVGLGVGLGGEGSSYP